MFPTAIKDAAEAMQRWQAPAEDVFKLWISFFPVAPAFGVTWRFASVLPGHVGGDIVPGAVTPKAPKTSTKAVKPLTRTVAKVADKAPAKVATPVAPAPQADKPEPKPAAKPAPKPAVEAAPKPAAATAAAAATVAPAAPAPAPKVEAAAPKVEAAEPAEPGKPANLLAAAPASPDDLKLIKGIGPALEKQLNGLGVYAFRQIAEMSESDLAWIDDNLTAFKGRCFRDDWIGQARAQLG
ncbi:MAG: 5' DNA nuclease [Pseudomonadota bacterium]